MNLRSIAAALLAVAVGSQPAGAADPPEQLPALCIDENAISVSGISSGAFFAHQYHVAHSARVMGAAIFAGGPYLCAGDDFPRSLFRSLNVCSHFTPGPFLGPPDAQRSITAARAAAKAGGIDDASGLRGDRVFLFSGRRDEFVPTPVVDAVRTFYKAFEDAANIAFVTDVDSSHAMVTKAFGNACDTSETPFLNACGYDLAGAALAHIYGKLEPSTTANGKLLAFDQTEFVKAGERHGLAPKGYAYVPEFLRARSRLSAARRLSRLLTERRYHRRRFHPWGGLQRVGGGEPHRRPLSADGRRHSPPCGRSRRLAEPAGLLGLVGVHRRRLRAQKRIADRGYRRHGRPARRQGRLGGLIGIKRGVCSSRWRMSAKPKL